MGRSHMTDTPFDTDRATIRIGFKNVLGSNWTRKTQPWADRAPLLERELIGPDGMRASVYFFVEVNRSAERRSLGRMLPHWDVVRTRGHNDAYSDPRKHRVLDSHEFPLGSTTAQGRRVTIVSYEHIATGRRWTAANTHLSSSVNTTDDRARASRATEATTLVELCRRFEVDVLAADLNNTVSRPDRPRGILAAAGFRDWRSVITVGNAEYDIHHEIGQPPPLRARHLDSFYFGPRVKALSGRIHITEPDSSDHFGLVCTVSID